MSDHTFYSTANHHNEREITIVNVSLLVGKAPTKEKRIRLKVRMLLSETINMGSPEWLDHAFEYVSKNHDVVSPKIEFKGYDLHFSAQNLFEAEGIKSPRCQMRKFEVHECGDSENPDVATSFTIYTPFSGPLWEWLGAFGGESCWCSFTPGVVSDAPAASQADADEENEDEGGFAEQEGDEDEEETPIVASSPTSLELVPGKHSAKELAEYHMDQLEAESKRGRGRPRKNTVDPLTVQEPVTAQF